MKECGPWQQTGVDGASKRCASRHLDTLYSSLRTGGTPHCIAPWLHAAARSHAPPIPRMVAKLPKHPPITNPSPIQIPPPELGPSLISRLRRQRLNQHPLPLLLCLQVGAPLPLGLRGARGWGEGEGGGGGGVFAAAGRFKG